MSNFWLLKKCYEIVEEKDCCLEEVASDGTSKNYQHWIPGRGRPGHMRTTVSSLMAEDCCAYVPFPSCPLGRSRWIWWLPVPKEVLCRILQRTENTCHFSLKCPDSFKRKSHLVSAGLWTSDHLTLVERCWGEDRGLTHARQAPLLDFDCVSCACKCMLRSEEGIGSLVLSLFTLLPWDRVSHYIWT